jgi:hypothetical protein
MSHCTVWQVNNVTLHCLTGTQCHIALYDRKRVNLWLEWMHLPVFAGVSPPRVGCMLQTSGVWCGDTDMRGSEWYHIEGKPRAPPSGDTNTTNQHCDHYNHCLQGPAPGVSTKPYHQGSAPNPTTRGQVLQACRPSPVSSCLGSHVTHLNTQTNSWSRPSTYKFLILCIA